MYLLLCPNLLGHYKQLFYPHVYLPSRNSPLLGQGLLIVEASRSHSDTPHSVGILWTSDQPDTDIST